MRLLTLSTGGRCIALSTPNGVGNWFHKTYIEAELEDNDFKPINLPWDAHPERDQEWFEKETKNMSRRQIAQELECNFNTSGETVIHPDDLEILREQALTEIIGYGKRIGKTTHIWLLQMWHAATVQIIRFS